MTEFSGLTTVDFRGKNVEVIYRKTRDDIEWFFLSDSLNEIPLTGQERRDIWREVWEHSK